MREREVLSVIGLVLRRGRSRDLFLNFLHCSMCLCLCVLVTKQRKTLIQCLAKGTEGDLEKKKGVGGGGGYWKMNGLEDKCMQARAGRPPLYTAPLP